MSPTLTKEFEPSAVRRGRLARNPVWYVTTEAHFWRFHRKRDALAFIAAGGDCPNHERILCRACNGQRLGQRGTGRISEGI